MANNQKQQLRQKLAQRHEERRTKEQEHFVQAPTGREARHQARAYANQEYAPTIRGIRGELASSRAAQKQSNRWYNQLGSEQAQAAQGEIAGANQFGSTLTQQLAQANNQNAAYLAQQQQAQAQNAALTGIPTQASSGQAAAAGANIGAQENVALNAPTLGAAYNQAALTRRLGLATKERGHEVANEDITARKAIRQDLQAAQKQKGQAEVGRLAEIKESARKQLLDNQALEVEGRTAQEQAALEQQKLAEARKQQGVENRQENTKIGNETAATATELKNEGRKTRVEEQEAATARQKAKREREEGPNGEAGLTPSEKLTRAEHKEAATAEATHYYHTLKSKGEWNGQWGALVSVMIGQGTPANLAQEAVNELKAKYTGSGVTHGPGETHR